jgi:hypothetical protein
MKFDTLAGIVFAGGLILWSEYNREIHIPLEIKHDKGLSSHPNLTEIHVTGIEFDIDGYHDIAILDSGSNFASIS